MDELNKLFQQADKALDDLFAEAKAEKVRLAKIDQDREDEMLHSLMEHLSKFIPAVAMDYIQYYPFGSKLRDDASTGHTIFFKLPYAYPIGLYVWQHQFSGEWHVDGTYGIYPNPELSLSPKWRAESFLLALGASRRHYAEDMKLFDTVTNQL